MLFTDIEGSTQLLKQLGDRYGELLAEHRRLLRESFDVHGGREMDTQGDAFFVAFSRARNAVEAAVQAQRALAAHEWPDGVECRVRMGLHTGEPSVGEEGYHGIGLHRGARIAGMARGGQILLSSTTAALVQEDLPGGVSLRDLGERQLKDIDRPERVYQLVAEGLPSEFPTLAKPASKRPRHRGRLAAASGVVVLAAAVAAVVIGTQGGSGPATAAVVSTDSVGIFHPGNGRPAGQVPVGSSPSAVVSGYDSIWVTNVDAHSVSRIDPVKQVVIDTIPVGNGPAGIAVGGGFVWVTNGLDGTVSQIDPKTDTVVNTVPAGNGPAGIAADARYVWVANSDDGTVTRIPLQGGKPLKPISVGQSADGVAVGDGSVWVTSEATGTLTRIDAESGMVVQPITVGSGADGVAVGADAVWVANRLDGTVTRIDPATNGVQTVIPVGDGPSSVAVEGNTVWVSNELAGTLSRIDPTRDVVAQILTTGNRPEGIVLTSAGLYVAVQASGVAHRGGTLNLLERDYLYGTIDPGVSDVSGAWQLLILTNDGLTGFRRTGGADGTVLVPDLAASLPPPTDNGTSYTFQLRPGIRYSTGTLVRPQDFRRAIERSLLHPNSPGSAYFAEIVGAETCIKSPSRCDLSRGIVTGTGNTVTFHLTSPDPDFLYALALPEAFAVPADTPVKFTHALPATGPYMFASLDPKHGITLVRNPHFKEWSPAAQPSGYPDSIVVRFGGTANAQVSAVEHGKADLTADAPSASPATLSTLQTEYASQLELNPEFAAYYFFLNTRVAPFDNVKVRQAVNYAVDRNELVALSGGPDAAQTTCQILPPNFPGYQRNCPYTLHPNSNGAWTAPDLAKARALVESSGTKGQLITLLSTPVFAARTRYFASVLKSIGYKTRIKTFKGSLGGYFGFAGDSRHKVQTGAGGWGADLPSASTWFGDLVTCASYQPHTSNNVNLSEFCDPSIDAELAHARALQTTNPDAGTILWSKIDRGLVEQAPWVPFINARSFDVVSSRVGNYEYNPQWGALLDQIWVR
jgi:peptide/nickel transport system substrate-binding protein